MSEKKITIRLESTAPAAWSIMCCTAIGMTRHLCRNWTL